MKQSVTALTLIVLFFSLVSCSKDDVTAGTDITGTYKFVSLQAKTTSTVQSVLGTDITKTVTTSDYTSVNNTGTVKIDATQFISTNLAYTINSTSHSTIYENGAVVDTLSFPLQVAIPSTSGTSTYKRIGADSLYFSSGSLLMGGSSTAAQSGGAKIKYENGKLTIYNNAVQSVITRNQGETVTNIANVAVVTTLQKQ